MIKRTQKAAHKNVNSHRNSFNLLKAMLGHITRLFPAFILRSHTLFPHGGTVAEIIVNFVN